MTITGQSLDQISSVTFPNVNLNAKILPGGTSTSLPISLFAGAGVPLGNYSFSITNPAGTTQSGTVTISVISPLYGPVSSWPGEGNASDIVNHNNGTLQNGIHFVPGMVGQAFSLDGTTGYVNVPDSLSLDQILSAITVDMWINPQQTNAGQYMFSRRDPLVSENFSIFIQEDGSVGVVTRTTTSPTVSGSVFASAPGIIQFGQFQHVAATGNTSSGLIKIYVNGQPLLLTNVYGPAVLSGSFFNVNHLYIGRRQDAATGEGVAGAQYFKGSIDEVDLYATELGETQIQAIFFAGASGKCSLQ